MKSPHLLILVAFAYESACARLGDPCPHGLTRAADLCVASLVDADAEAGTTFDDGGRRLLMDGGQVDHEEAGMSDSPVLDGPLQQDPNHGNSEPDTTCAAEDISRWRDFHLSAELVAQIGECAAENPGCVGDSCNLGTCLSRTRRISGCSSCISEEIACANEACVAACGASGTNDACRACACAHGCVAQFALCSVHDFDVCADCDATSCANASLLPPELIMIVVNGVLFAP